MQIEDENNSLIAQKRLEEIMANTTIDFYKIVLFRACEPIDI